MLGKLNSRVYIIYFFFSSFFFLLLSLFFLFFFLSFSFSFPFLSHLTAHLNTVGLKSYDKAKKYLLDNPVILSSHAVGYMLLLCLDYMMDDQEEMAFRIATQYQLVQFCLDLASSSRQDPRSAVHPLFKRIDQNHDQYVDG